MSNARLLAARREDETARRDLALVAVTVVGLSRLIEPPAVWFVAIFLLGAVLVGTLQVLADTGARAEGGGAGVPIESLILPAVAAVACVGAIRLVPFGLGLAPALLITGVIVDRCLALEARILASPAGLDAEARTTVLVTTLVVAFLGFVGVAATIPGGLAQPGSPGAGGAPLSERDLVVLAAGDAVIAFLLGYRAAALRVANVRDALWSAGTYAAAIAIGAAAVRFIEVPRLLGPALLTLTFYLWDAFHGAAPARRRDLGWLWQTILLVVLGIVVVALNLMTRP
ncbi:MAG: hypothetical protein QOD78_2479 [Chloroflexota bacterium]|jgi:hypothetical protein|nr:hypothetical protein [Chloroflexota bacterium]